MKKNNFFDYNVEVASRESFLAKHDVEVTEMTGSLLIMDILALTILFFCALCKSNARRELGAKFSYLSPEEKALLKELIGKIHWAHCSYIRLLLWGWIAITLATICSAVCRLPFRPNGICFLIVLGAYLVLIIILGRVCYFPRRQHVYQQIDHLLDENPRVAGIIDRLGQESIP